MDVKEEGAKEGSGNIGEGRAFAKATLSFVLNFMFGPSKFLRTCATGYS